MTKLTLYLSFLLYGTTVTFGQPGTLDAEFGNNGLVQTISGIGSGNSTGNKLVLQPDGKILVATLLQNGWPQMGVYRYLSDGTLDDSFGTAGLARVISTNWSVSSGFDVVLQSDGKIVAGGMAGSPDNNLVGFGLARFLENGQLDTVFGRHGTVLYRPWNEADRLFIGGVIAQPDDKIILFGIKTTDINTGSTEALGVVMRFLSDGALDSTFAEHGVFTTSASELSDAQLLPNGNIFVAGSIKSQFPYKNDFLLFKLLPNGLPDPSFGKNGIVTSNFNHRNEQEYDLALQSDGKILMVGREYDRITAARYTVAGDLDTSFAETGVFYYVNVSVSEATRIVVQQDDKLVLGGNLYTDDEFGHNQILLRLLKDGTVDSTFGNAGVVLTDYQSDSKELLAGMVLQPDQKIIVSGSQFSPGNINRTILARYNNAITLGTHSTAIKHKCRLSPNPTTGSLKFEYSLARKSNVKLELFDMFGHSLSKLLEIKDRESGMYQEDVMLDSSLPSGVYKLHFVTRDQDILLPVVKANR